MQSGRFWRCKKYNTERKAIKSLRNCKLDGPGSNSIAKLWKVYFFSVKVKNKKIRFSDIWSLGGTVVEMLTGKPPFNNIGNPLATMYKIVQDNKAPEMQEEVSKDCKDFLMKCLNVNPKERWNTYMLLRHPFIIE